MNAFGPLCQRSVVARRGLQGIEYAQQARAAGIGQVALMHRRLLQLVHQHLGQARVGCALGNLHVAGGKVLEDRLDDLADGQGTALPWQVLAHRRRQAHGSIANRLMAVEAVFGVRRHPHRVLRRRHETAAGNLHVQHAMGRVLEGAPGMAMGRGKAMGSKIGVAKVHRGW